MNIYDIAKLTGVSASTVSRVVNGKPGVGKAKRKEIEEALKKYNYAPDETARSLVMQSSHMVGILTDNVNSRRQNEGIARIENELLNKGYLCFTKYIGEGEDSITEGIQELARRRVEGALMLGVRFRRHDVVGPAISRYLPEVPVVLVHQSERVDLPNVYCIGADERRGIRKCIRRLVDGGRKQLVLMVDRGRVSEKQIAEYYLDMLEEFPGVCGQVFTDIESTVQGGMREMTRILAETPDIDGVLCVQDAIAIGAMYACLDAGKKVPEDISIIGEDNSVMCEACRPRLTSLDTMITATTTMSARLLMDVLSGQDAGHRLNMEMELVERESL